MDEWEREFYWKLMDAWDARANGNDRAALKFLDAAERLFARHMQDEPRRKVRAGRGRPEGSKNKKPDRDQWALLWMAFHGRGTGETNPRELARWAFKQIGVSPNFEQGASETAFIQRLSTKYEKRHGSKPKK